MLCETRTGWAVLGTHDAGSALDASRSGLLKGVAMIYKRITIAGWMCLAAVGMPPAAATVRVFVTPASAGYGLTNIDNAFQPTHSVIYANGLQYALDFTSGDFACVSFPPVDAPSGTCDNPVLLSANDFGYIWLQFQNEPADLRINGIMVRIQECGQTEAAAVNVCYYVQNNSQGPPPVDHRRWGGAINPPYYPEWRQNPQGLTAISTAGIANLATDPPQDENWNMHAVQASGGSLRTGVSLIGAVQVEPGKKYEVLLMYINVIGGPGPVVAGGAFYCGGGATAGACCLADSTCALMAPDECTGLFLGAGSACDPDPCPAPCVGDLNCDGYVDFGDINPFVLHLADYAAWATANPGCNPLNGDINGDGTYGQGSFGAINPFVALIASGQGPCP